MLTDRAHDEFTLTNLNSGFLGIGDFIITEDDNMERFKLTFTALLVTLSLASVAQAGRDDAGERAADRAAQKQETTATEPTREVASDFTNDYLDSVKDERANDETIAQKDSKDHDAYLRSLRGTTNR